MFTRLFIALLITFTLCIAPSAARESVVAISPYQSPTEAKQQVKSVLQFLTTLEPGDRTVLIDGFNLNTLGYFTIPENKAYASVKARLGVNKTIVRKMLAFAKSAKAPGGEEQPTVPSAIRLPQLVRTIAENLSPTEPLDVIVFGSPFYDDPKEIGFSMAGGVFPSDAHLKMSRSDTPFGASDNPNLLSNIRIHVGFEGESNFPTDQHRFFWTLYVEKQGGELVTFSGDASTVYDRVKRRANAPSHTYKIENSERMEMIRLRREEVEQPIRALPLTSLQLTAQQAGAAPNVEIGITWDERCIDCDLDLYAGIPGKDVLFFGKPETPEGEHFKDYQHSPQSINGFETITFRVPVDLRVLRLGVSFYAGSAPNGATGEIRISIGGEIYASPFHLSATSGNKGESVAQAFQTGQSNDHFIVIDPLQVVGL